MTTMLEMLEAAERELTRIFSSDDALEGEGWRSLRVDYHAPFVDRLYREWNGQRIYLHVIHPCAPEEALFHPHPWPSAMRILSGKYEMGVGYGTGDAPPPVAARIVAHGPMIYEMTDPDAWHYVRPIDGVASTVMVTGTPWNRSSPRPSRPLSELPPERVKEMLIAYREAYRRR